MGKISGGEILMRKIGFIIGFICLTGLLYAEEITLMSYYPVPSGNYNSIKAKRMWIGERADGSLLDSGNGIFQVGDITSENCSIFGNNTNGIGIFGVSNSGPGVRGSSVSASGVVGESASFYGVYGESRDTTTNFSGVYGISTNGKGVEGRSTNFYGVYGGSVNSHGVVGGSTNTDGSGYGVYGWSVGENGVGVYGSSSNYAGYFDGNLRVTKRASFGIPNIPVFISTTARDSFYTSNGMEPQQGDLIYLNDSSPGLQICIGTSWVDL